MSESAAPSEPKRSAVELQKEESGHLRGTIAAELANADLDHLSEANKSLIKFHGSYQQEDRDARKARRKEGVGKHYMFMVRCRIPGGRLSAAQYLAIDDLAGRFANGPAVDLLRAARELDPPTLWGEVEAWRRGRSDDEAARSLAEAIPEIDVAAQLLAFEAIGKTHTVKFVAKAARKAAFQRRTWEANR